MRPAPRLLLPLLLSSSPGALLSSSPGSAASPSAGSKTDSKCQHEANAGWWPGTPNALALVDTLGCVREGSEGHLQQQVCVGEEVVDALGRVVGRAEPTNSCLAAEHVQQWVTTADGRLVPALQKWFVRGTACSGGGPSSRRVLFFCGGGAGNLPAITWSGPAEEARFWATKASWMRTLPPAVSSVMQGLESVPEGSAPLACEEELHVGVPALCDLLPTPEWLPRYERLLLANPEEPDPVAAGGGWETGATEDSRPAELAATHALIEASWQLDVERGDITPERKAALVVGLREEAVISSAVDDSARPRPETVGANYDFTYGEISAEGGLM